MKDSTASALHRVNVRAGGGGNSGGPLQEIQERAFRPQNVSQVATHDTNGVPRGNRISLLRRPFYRAAARLRHCFGEAGAGQDTAAPVLDHAGSLQPCRDSEAAGDIQAAVFGQRCCHDAFDLAFGVQDGT
jgi:hypothetical protein